MNIGETLYNLRKEKGFSQEEVADELNVSRQTVSKWETGESKPDIDKISPICELFDISYDELLDGRSMKSKENDIHEDDSETSSFINDIKRKRALFISCGIFCYFMAIMLAGISDEIGFGDFSAIIFFFLFCGIGTVLIIYQGVAYSLGHEEKIKLKKEENKKKKLVIEIAATVFAFLYFFISFITMRWDVSWVIWIIFFVVKNIINLLFELGDEKNGK